ncbi:MAG: hypothetical protein A3J81_03680 [Nitrospirae bacterium RIFOXYB2_FULL_43_5]|nr:MAG: hypothetical protein A3J81_03680 [Nitrospirae bacterium RIFOXYB2_FULL_43_5]
MVFFVTARCNAKCDFCFYQKNKTGNRNELTLPEIEKFSAKLGNVYEVLLSGGEPFLRDDIYEIGKTFAKNNGIVHLNIPTNGFLEDKAFETISRLSKDIKAVELSAMVSIDNIGEKHDKIRGIPGLFNRATALIKNLAILQKERKNLRTGIIITLNKSNINDIKEIIDYIKNDLGIYYICLNYPRGEAVEEGKYAEVPLEVYKSAVEYLFKGKYEQFRSSTLLGRFANSVDLLRYENVLRTLKEKRAVHPCRAGRNTVVVNEVGDVFPCELLGMKLGNLREADYDVRKIMALNRKACFENIVSKKCYCSWECLAHWNMMYAPKSYFGILKKMLF